MKPIYRASFRLTTDIPPTELANAVAADAFRWALIDPRRKGLQPAGPIPTKAETLKRRSLGEGYEVEALSASSGDDIAWGLRFSNLDEDPTVKWITDVSVHSPDGDGCQFSCSVFLARDGEATAPMRRHTSRPRIVRDILKKFSGKAGFPLHASPVSFGASNAELFANFLQSPQRTHPVLFLSPPPVGYTSPFKPQNIADFLAGVAHVVITDDPDATWRLADFIPNQLNCYAGAVRLYWPGFKPSDSPISHPLWSPQRLGMLGPSPTARLGQRVLDIVSNVAVFNLHERFLTWERLHDIARQQALEKAKQSRNDKEMLALYEEENKSLMDRLRSRDLEVEQLADELRRQRSLVDTYLYALEHRELVPAEEKTVLPATSVAEAIENAEREHSERLAFALNSKSDKRSPFETPEEIERAFNWLATTYYDAKTDRKPCPDLAKSIAESIDGWHYSEHQKMATMKAN